MRVVGSGGDCGSGDFSLLSDFLFNLKFNAANIIILQILHLYMCVCVCVYIYIYIYMYIFVCVYKYIYIYLLTCSNNVKNHITEKSISRLLTGIDLSLPALQPGAYATGLQLFLTADLTSD